MATPFFALVYSSSVGSTSSSSNRSYFRLCFRTRWRICGPTVWSFDKPSLCRFRRRHWYCFAALYFVFQRFVFQNKTEFMSAVFNETINIVEDESGFNPETYDFKQILKLLFYYSEQGFDLFYSGFLYLVFICLTILLLLLGQQFLSKVKKCSNFKFQIFFFYKLLLFRWEGNTVLWRNDRRPSKWAPITKAT